MSQQFYERFISTVFLFLAILTIAVLSGLIGFAWFLSGNKFLLMCFAGSLNLIYFFSVFEFDKFRNLREDLRQGLLMEPRRNNDQEIEPLDMNLEGTALNVCLAYRNGHSLTQIESLFQLNHANQTKRLLIKDLDILLKEHKQKEAKI